MHIWWLDPDGSDLTGNGSYARPWQTFSKAMASFSSGDQIRLKPGTYNPSDSVMFDSVEGSIFSDTPGGATIKPVQVMSSNSVIQVENSDRFSIHGVNIQQAHNPTNNTIGILGLDVTNFLVHTCAVSDFGVPSAATGLSTAGIAVSGYGRIEDCSIFDLNAQEDYLYGIYTAGLVDVVSCAVYSLSGYGACRVRGISQGGTFNMASWNTPVNANLIPLIDCTYDIGSAAKRFKDAYFCGKLTVAGGIDPTYMGFYAIDPAVTVPPNLSIFVNSSDNKLKWKNASGVVSDVGSGTSGVPGTYTGSTLTSYPAGLPDGSTDTITITAPSVGEAVTEGLVMKVTLTDSSALGSGDVRVKIYNDQAKAELIFDRVFNLAATPLIDTIPAHFKSDNIAASGAMYITITNNTGSTGTFGIEARAASVLATTAAPVGSGSGVNSAVVGDGLEFDGTRINLATTGVSSGLELTGTSPNKSTRVKVGTYIQRTASGIDVTSGVVVNTGVQNVGGIKRFTASSLGLTPAALPGPPVGAGTTYAAGDLYLDSNRVLWMCYSAGAPGDWQLFGWDYSQGIDLVISAGEDNADYTGEIPAGSYEDVTISVTGNRGIIRKLTIWATDPAGGDDFPATDLDQAYRVGCYASHTRYGREAMWIVLGQARKTYLTAGATGGVDTDLTVNDINLAGPDDLLRVRDKATPAEEYGRVETRDAGGLQYELDREVLNTFNINDPVMIVTEFLELPFVNLSLVTPQSVFLRFFNDGATNVKFGYQLDVESIGGGSTV